MSMTMSCSYSVFTVLNTVKHKDQDWIKQLQDFLSGKAPNSTAKKMVEVSGNSGIWTQRIWPPMRRMDYFGFGNFTQT